MRNRGLGWLSKSAVLPNKAEVIKGVTGSTLVNLKASLYNKQQQSTNMSRKVRTERRDLIGKNRIVELKIKKKKDGKSQRKVKQEKYREDVMKKKSELYQKLMRGEMNIHSSHVLVDFKSRPPLPQQDFESGGGRSGEGKKFTLVEFLKTKKAKDPNQLAPKTTMEERKIVFRKKRVRKRKIKLKILQKQKRRKLTHDSS